MLPVNSIPYPYSYFATASTTPSAPSRLRKRSQGPAASGKEKSHRMNDGFEPEVGTGAA